MTLMGMNIGPFGCSTSTPAESAPSSLTDANVLVVKTPSRNVTATFLPTHVSKSPMADPFRADVTSAARASLNRSFVAERHNSAAAGAARAMPLGKPNCPRRLLQRLVHFPFSISAVPLGQELRISGCLCLLQAFGADARCVSGAASLVLGPLVRLGGERFRPTRLATTDLGSTEPGGSRWIG
jgi:hypothetical protein